MARKTLACCGWLGLFVIAGLADQVVPVAVSPGRAKGVAVVSELRPTFSWTSVDWAVGYRIAVFEAPGIVADSYEQMASSGMTPVLTREIEGRGLSWTPSSEETLPGGGMYIWYVEAVSPSGPGIWSSGRVFIVNTASVAMASEDRAIRVLRERGIREEVISEVVKEIKSGSTNTVTGGADSNPPGGIRTTGTEGADNTFYGQLAGNATTTGYKNTFLGARAGSLNVLGHNNTFLGYNAGYSNTSTQNTFLGSEAGYTNAGGYQNTFVGQAAGRLNVGGYNNVFVGQGAGVQNTEGHGNGFLGYNAGFSNTTGNYSLYLGYNAGYNETGSYKLYVDSSSTTTPLIYGEFDNDILAVNGKFAVGTQAPTYPMELKTTGRNATFILQRSDGGALNFINATSSYGQFGTGNNYPVRIQVNNAWKMQLNADNSLSMASGATCTAGGVWTDSSSRELKENIEGLTVEEATNALSNLDPVKYNYKVDKAERYVGFIAEDVPDLVASKDRKTLSPMEVVAVLTKVVQEQQKTIADLKSEIAEMKKGTAK